MCPVRVADEGVEQVLVMFKCHLDVGFAQTEDCVLDRYFDQHLPGTIQIGRWMREHTADRSIWTVPAWLLHTYLERAAADDVRAMEDGDIAWHALPFTWYTELLDRSSVAASLGFSQRLDARIGRQTTAARLTDVSGHTRGLVGPLAEAGVTFLDIGCNPGCRAPAVPYAGADGILPDSWDDPADPDNLAWHAAEPVHADRGTPREERRRLAVEAPNATRSHLFRWRDTDGRQVTVLYHPHGYGSTVRVPGTSSVLSMRVHGDNFGPHSTASVQTAYAMLRRKFPNAAVRAANLSQMGEVLEPVSGSFPLLTKEIGYSWIYGTGSDPAKSADLRELLRLRGEWLDQGRIRPADELDLASLSQLLPAPEHNWSLNTSVYLRRWDTYRVGELMQARAEDPDFRLNDQEWNAKRARPGRAAAALPEPLRDEAAQRLEALRERAPHPAQAQAYGSDTILDNGILRATVSARTGALVELTDQRSGVQWAGPGGLGTFSYQVFDAEEYLRYHRQHNHARLTYNDLGKPGPEKYPARPGDWTATAAGIRPGAGSVSVIADLVSPVPADRDELLAWPSRVALRYDLRPGRDAIGMTCWLEGKRANRGPEEYWIAFCPNAPDVTGWRMDKLGQEVDPLDVIDDGGRHLHGVGTRVRYSDDRGSVWLGTLDAHLVSPGGPGLLRFDNDPLDLSAGVWVNLYNNLWGTAFPQWYDQDMRFRFTLTVRGPTEGLTP